MTLRNTVLMVGAVAMAASMQTAQAAITLSDLINHTGGSDGTLTVGDKTFSNFGFVASDPAAAGLALDANGLTVTAVGSGTTYGLDWSGGIAVDNTLGTANLVGDLKLTYVVTVNNPAQPIYMIDQNYTPNATPGSGQITIGETVHQGNTVLGSIVANSTLTLNPTDLSDPIAEAGDNLFLSTAQTQLYVVKDILITADAGQLVGLSDVAQSFHEVPEPTTVLAGALLLLPLGASTLRILRRNRMS